MSGVNGTNTSGSPYPQLLSAPPPIQVIHHHYPTTIVFQQHMGPSLPVYIQQGYPLPAMPPTTLIEPSLALAPTPCPPQQQRGVDGLGQIVNLCSTQSVTQKQIHEYLKRTLGENLDKTDVRLWILKLVRQGQLLVVGSTRDADHRKPAHLYATPSYAEALQKQREASTHARAVSSKRAREEQAEDSLDPSKRMRLNPADQDQSHSVMPEGDSTQPSYIPIPYTIQCLPNGVLVPPGKHWVCAKTIETHLRILNLCNTQPRSVPELCSELSLVKSRIYQLIELLTKRELLVQVLVHRSLQVEYAYVTSRYHQAHGAPSEFELPPVPAVSVCTSEDSTTGSLWDELSINSSSNCSPASDSASTIDIEKYRSIVALCQKRPYIATELCDPLGVTAPRVRALIRQLYAHAILIKIGSMRPVDNNKPRAAYATLDCAKAWDVSQASALWGPCAFQISDEAGALRQEEQIVALCDEAALTLSQISRHIDVSEQGASVGLKYLARKQRIVSYGHDQWVTPALQAFLAAQQVTLGIVAQLQ